MVILLIVILVIATTVRKMIIISSLSEKAESTIKLDNYHTVLYSYEQDQYTRTEIFSMSDKKKIISTTVTNGEIKTQTLIATKSYENEYGDDRYLVNRYTEIKLEKIAVLNLDMGISVTPQNALYTNNLWQLFIYSLNASVKNTINGEKYTMPSVEYVYEFDTVTENDFEEPDISEYTVKDVDY